MLIYLFKTCPACRLLSFLNLKSCVFHWIGELFSHYFLNDYFTSFSCFTFWYQNYPMCWYCPTGYWGSVCFNTFLLFCEVTQSCLTLCNPLDISLPGSSIQGIFQARILEWVAISFSRRSSWPRDWTRVSCIVGLHLTVWATRGLYSLLFRRNHFCWSVLKFIDCFHYHIHYAFKPIYWVVLFNKL